MGLVKRFFEIPKQSFFLFGPRGTGKSTWLREIFPEAFWIDLLDFSLLRRYEAYPERLKEVVDACPDHSVIVIDEIQKVPALLSMVHLLIEEKRGLQFVLTGSSTRKLKRAGVNLLGGRALLRQMHPFMASELQDLFSLEKALKIGMLPLVFSSEMPVQTLEAYAGVFLKEEVQAEGLVRHIDQFARFLETISFSHSNLLNTTNIARECQVNRKTVENYLQIIEDLLISFTLPVFTKRAQRMLVAHPKFYLFDCGIFRSLRPKGPLDRPEEIEGAALEGLVAQHLKAWIAAQLKTYNLYFWRTRAGQEVDFIIYGEEGLWAIEVKNTTRLSSSDLKGLQAFQQDYPEAKCLCLYRGNERLQQGGVLCLPCEAFLRDLDPMRAPTSR